MTIEQTKALERLSELVTSPGMGPGQDTPNPYISIDRSELRGLVAALSAIQPQWGDDTPTEPGWYWTREPGCDCGCENIVFIAHYTQDDTLRIVERERNCTGAGRLGKTNYEWSGPITPPQTGE